MRPHFGFSGLCYLGMPTGQVKWVAHTTCAIRFGLIVVLSGLGEGSGLYILIRVGKPETAGIIAEKFRIVDNQQ